MAQPVREECVSRILLRKDIMEYPPAHTAQICGSMPIARVQKKYDNRISLIQHARGDSVRFDPDAISGTQQS